MLAPVRSRSPLPPRSPPPLRLASPPSTPPSRRDSPPSTPTVASSRAAPSTSTAIPWRRLLPVLVFRVADAVTYTVIFPFVTDMITSFDVPRDRIGLYAGIAEGALMLVEAGAATTWARLADRYGRRRCLLWGFTATLVAAAMTGFSRGVWSLIFWRAAFGLNPSGIVARLLAAEISTPANRARVFSVFSPSFSVGVMLGTLMGGQLARPHGRLPAWLGGASATWERWPYGLPCLAAAGLGAAVVVLSWFTLEETRPPALAKPVRGEAEKSARPASIAAAFRVPHFGVVLATFCPCFSFDGIFAVYTYTAVPVGGLGLPITTIGGVYFAGAVAYVALAPFCIQRLQRRFGAVRALAYMFTAWIVVALSVPVAQATAADARPVMWIALAVQMLAKEVGYFAWPLTDMLQVNLFDDYPELLATGSAISLIAGSAGRAAGPAAAGWLYSRSTAAAPGSPARAAPWLALLATSIAPVVLVRFVPRAAGKDDPGKQREEEDGYEGYEAVPLAPADGRASRSDD